LRDRHEVAQEGVRDEDGGDRIEDVLGRLSGELLRSPSLRIQANALFARPLPEPLDGPVDRFEEHRLRAGPAAPHAAEERRRVREGERDAREQEEDEPNVLRIEARPEQEELAMLDIEEERGVTFDRDARQSQPKNDERIEDDLARRREATAH